MYSRYQQLKEQTSYLSPSPSGKYLDVSFFYNNTSYTIPTIPKDLKLTYTFFFFLIQDTVVLRQKAKCLVSFVGYLKSRLAIFFLIVLMFGVVLMKFDKYTFLNYSAITSDIYQKLNEYEVLMR
jgi:hypothetical protein